MYLSLGSFGGAAIAKLGTGFFHVGELLGPALADSWFVATRALRVHHQIGQGVSRLGLLKPAPGIDKAHPVRRHLLPRRGCRYDPAYEVVDNDKDRQLFE